MYSTQIGPEKRLGSASKYICRIAFAISGLQTAIEERNDDYILLESEVHRR
jgi:hypothetical protein